MLLRAMVFHQMGRPIDAVSLSTRFPLLMVPSLRFVSVLIKAKVRGVCGLPHRPEANLHTKLQAPISANNTASTPPRLWATQHPHTASNLPIISTPPTVSLGPFHNFLLI